MKRDTPLRPGEVRFEHSPPDAVINVSKRDTILKWADALKYHPTNLGD